VTRFASRRLALVASVSIAAACTLFNPLEDYGPPKPKLADAGDGGSNGDDDAGCQRLRWPDPPTSDDSTNEVEISFAIDSIAVGSLGSGLVPGRKSNGFDLDGVCTCPGPPSCAPPKGADPACDTDGGVDHAGTTLLDDFISSAGVGESASAGVANGETGFLFKLSKYNGAKNDTKVVFAIFPSPGTEIDGTTGKESKPRHDGTDQWRVSKEALVGGAGPPFIPLFVDTSAYVSNGVLVARADFPLPLGNLLMRMTGAYVVADIVPAGSSFRLDNGRLVGRWPTSELLTSLDVLKDPLDETKGLCGTSRLYGELKARICASPDLVTDPSLDRKDAPCNALGMLVLFTAEPVILSSASDPKVRDHRCGPEWSDQCR
jgi:hypothetical protein